MNFSDFLGILYYVVVFTIPVVVIRQRKVGLRALLGFCRRRIWIVAVVTLVFGTYMILVAGADKFWIGCVGGAVVSLWFLLINAAYKVENSG